MSEDSAAVQPSPSSVADLLLARAATRGERVYAAIRSALCLFVLARFTAIEVARGPTSVVKIGVEVLLVSGVLAFSFWEISAGRRRLFSTRTFLASVALDAAGLFVVLSTNVIWPDDDFTGILNMTDAAPLYFTVIATGMRLSPDIVTFGGVLNFLSLSGLVALDIHYRGIAYSVADISLPLGYMLTSVAIGYVLAWRTNSLVKAGALESMRAELAKKSLDVVLRDHHDARSLLSSLQLNTDFLREELASQQWEKAKILAHKLSLDARELGAVVSSVRDRSYTELAALGAILPADVAVAAQQATDTVWRRFPELILSVRLEPSRVAVPGGNEGLRRVLENLLTNAAEGDGNRGATRVELTSRSAPPQGFVCIVVRDDGPGFPEHLMTDPAARVSLKKQSSGLGLWIVRNVVQASGGSLMLSNHRSGGAEVIVELPLALNS